MEKTRKNKGTGSWPMPSGDSTRSANVSTREAATVSTPEQINKWLTVWRYSHGYLSEAGTTAAFAVHPEWVNA